MKFMKLGSKPDALQSDGGNVRFVSSELATDITVRVGSVKFQLHKFPLLSKSARLQKLVMSLSDDHRDEVDVSDIPGGPSSFEICAKFCYGMTITLNPYNIAAARCAAEFLEMYESIEKSNLVYKIEVFLASSIFRSWKDSIIVLQTTRALLPYSEELKLVSQCIESLSTKACVDPSRVDWSYTYNRRRLSQETEENDLSVGIGSRPVPKDWWVEDLCELDVELYKHVLANIKMKCSNPNKIIGESLKAYAYRKLPEFSKGADDTRDMMKYRATVEAVILLLPEERCSVSCGFMLKLLKSAMSVDLGEAVKRNLVKKIGRQLEEASATDLLIKASEVETLMYDVDTVIHILQEFLSCEGCNEIEPSGDAHQLQEGMLKPGILSEASKLMVAKLIDSYLGEIAKDPYLPLSKFVELAEMMSGIRRPSHDGLYRAIDTYLKEHPGIGKSERRRICRLMDCKKLTPDTCLHAVHNDQLPLRVVVQVLFFEQVRTAVSSGSSTPDLLKGIRDLNNLSRGSSRSATTGNNDKDWDTSTAAEELKALKSELASLRLSNALRTEKNGNGMDRTARNKVKGILQSRKIFSKMLSGKGGGENSGSDSSGSSGSENAAGDDTKQTPSRNRRNSVS
ncbi:hypothetical protein MLD38_022893 [Melastoma candidum]|uniref:Uncharacterized protein n=1 Tax=Melastoma candidum TaxID=119954 RepID=A0ACB9QMK7_9MYRT|nr:hypothetical protein MLD38_022893 [Melastoma candidum]